MVWFALAKLISEKIQTQRLSSEEGSILQHRVMSQHERVFSYIQEKVSGGDLRPGTKLDGERKLAKELAVSRETVRQGLKLAEEAGIVVRMATLGTFVAPPRVDQELGEMLSFNSTIRQLSLEPSYESVEVNQVSLTALQASRLEVQEGDPALQITEIGVANDLPLAYYVSLLPKRVFSRLPENPPWSSDATYLIAARAYNVLNLTAHQEFEAVGMPRVIAHALKVAPGSPSFLSISLFSSGGVPLELRTAHYPGSRYRFRASRDVRF